MPCSNKTYHHKTPFSHTLTNSKTSLSKVAGLWNPTPIWNDGNVATVYKQENRSKRRMLPKLLVSINGRTCNTTPLVHQDMTKKTKTVYEKK